ncbi:MAG: hypothetical protein NTY68_02585 [Candidatus Micrarchaeota archaeon]|nr:hypothetical protein [Candidatus Micrarchaeota archaeon]
MANITLSVSDDLHKKMKEFSEVKWSEVARKAIQERVNALELAESIASKSKLTQKDIDEFSGKMKHLAARRFVK